MEYLKYKMMKITVICLIILILIILCFPFAYNNMMKNNNNSHNNVITEEQQLQNNQVTEEPSDTEIEQTHEQPNYDSQNTESIELNQNRDSENSSDRLEAQNFN